MRTFNALIPNTFGIETCCDCLIEFQTVEELISCYPSIAQARRDGNLLIVGRGSNLLPVDDFHGMVLRSRIMGIHSEEDGNNAMVTCGSGETMDEVIEWCIGKGYYGMENLSLIPGDVGASAVQNIGAYGVEAKDFISSLHAFDLETQDIVEISGDQCHYAYRSSIFKNEWKNRFVILDVTYSLSKIFNPVLNYGNISSAMQTKDISAQQLRQVIIDIRRAKLPDWEVEGNAGSFFMNPVVGKEKYEALIKKFPDMPHYNVDSEHEKIPAGWLIDQCGWKGRSIGRAGVHNNQALVLVNRGGATGQEIVLLAERIQRDVKDRFGIKIHPEVNILRSSTHSKSQEL